MPPALPCTVPECNFTTPANLTSEVAMQLLVMHRQDQHGTAPLPGSLSTPNSSTAKVERPARPTIKQGMSETSWNFFLHEWKRYTRQTGIKEATLIDELWSCMDTELRELAFNEGFEAASEEDLLANIKSLAVTILHPSVHVVALHRMQQQDGESIKAFGARVKGTAKNCNLTKLCTKIGCDQQVPYLEETAYHVVMAGLFYKDLRDKVKAQAMLGSGHCERFI